MELLVIKNGADYIRIKDKSYSAVGLDKASVFPFEGLAKVKDQLTDVQAGGFPEAAIYRLTLTETPL
ncbi:MAG: hypothetical protein HGJ94_13215 [Desulfosarcina sp.]|nr:hypothetical protein [Desulfosarcina sp.]MBC2743577.1 hypothetical protein [Desulfosarcina sp.]MBC2766486.1 hypothetical protein [Desulfosarcina sp.]